MRVLYLNHNVAGSGTYQRVVNFGRELTTRGHDVTVVTTSRTRRSAGTERDEKGLRVIEAPDLLRGGARNGWDAWNTMWRTWRLHGERFDLIHAFDCRPAVIGPALAQQRSTGSPLFLDWADWWGRGGTIGERSGPLVRTLWGPVETWLEESFRTGATANTVISRALRERCVALGVPAARVLCVPNGCMPPQRADTARRTAAREAVGAGAGPLIAHVGVMQTRDADMLFDALRGVVRALPDTRLALIGHYHGAVPGDLESVVRRTGYVDDAQLSHWLAAANAGVVPLRDTIASRGRWPGKVNEYLTAGLPVVLPAVGDAAAVIGEHGAGRLSEPTATSLAEALLAVLRAPASEHAALSRAATELAAGPLAWSRLADELVDFYTRWLHARERGAVQLARSN